MPDLKTISEEIDAHFDAMLIDGMSYEQALWVEQQRDAAHQKIMAWVFRQGDEEWKNWKRQCLRS
jgi:hypothetical protein